MISSFEQQQSMKKEAVFNANINCINQVIVYWVYATAANQRNQNIGLYIHLRLVLLT